MSGQFEVQSASRHPRFFFSLLPAHALGASRPIESSLDGSLLLMHCSSIVQFSMIGFHFKNCFRIFFAVFQSLLLGRGPAKDHPFPYLSFSLLLLEPEGVFFSRIQHEQMSAG
jgi:hypothetical protein